MDFQSVFSDMQKSLEDAKQLLSSSRKQFQELKKTTATPPSVDVDPYDMLSQAIKDCCPVSGGGDPTLPKIDREELKKTLHSDLMNKIISSYPEDLQIEIRKQIHVLSES
jgi:hypothetical protein